MLWRLSNRASPAGRLLADRHYSRQTVGAVQFVPPGRCVVLVGNGFAAVWVTSWQMEQFVDHDWPGAWVCTLFRREGGPVASALIRSAVAATRFVWPDTPPLGMVTFVDPAKVRRKRDPGRCFRKAGFTPVGVTHGGLLVLQMLPADMPESHPPIGAQRVFA